MSLARAGRDFAPRSAWRSSNLTEADGVELAAVAQEQGGHHLVADAYGRHGPCIPDSDDVRLESAGPRSSMCVPRRK